MPVKSAPADLDPRVASSVGPSENRVGPSNKNKGKKEGRKEESHPTLPNLLSLAAILDTSRHVGDTVLNSVRQALQTVADSLGASGVVDGLAETTSSSAYETTCGAREAADCCAELGGSC
jgi:hypothetical protein